MTILFFIFAAIVVLGPLVALHEYGHFWVARKLGVKVLTYSIGFGPALWQRTGKDGVDYRLSAIPLGGYVRMLDEREAEVAEEEKHLAFNNQKPWKKILIVAAGPAMNFLIAIVLFWLLLLPASEQLNMRVHQIIPDTPAAVAGLQVDDTLTQIAGKDTNTWKAANLALINHMGETATIPVTYERAGNIQTAQLQVKDFLQDQSQDVFKQVGFMPYMPHVPAIIGDIQRGSSAQKTGLQVGDEIININGTQIADWHAMTAVIHDNPEKLLSITVMRAGKPVALDVIPQRFKTNAGESVGRIGVRPDRSKVVIPENYKQTISYDPLSAFIKSLQQTWDLSVLTLSAMGKMVSGLIGLDNLSGPITIAKVSGDMMSIGWKPLLSFMALMSVSLAVLNLLPIPILDGGHLVFYTYEAIVGKPIPEKIQLMGLNIGLILMFCFMVLAIGNDISRLF